jgi:hypothetical protein
MILFFSIKTEEIFFENFGKIFRHLKKNFKIQNFQITGNDPIWVSYKRRLNFKNIG